MHRKKRGGLSPDFKRKKEEIKRKNPAVFDSVNLKNMYVMLNATRYPALDYNPSFANQQYSRAYGDASMFGVRYFGMDELVTRSNISPIDYNHCTLCLFST